jgi:sugar phosphate isomerase/epimerase
MTRAGEEMGARPLDGHEIEFTMLNSMAGKDLGASLDRHVEWGLTFVDLKDHILGKKLSDLSLEEAAAVRAMCDERGLRVYCLSSNVFMGDVASGEVAFVHDGIKTIEHVLQLARTLRPRFVRLLGGQMSDRPQSGNAIEYLEHHFPWVTAGYRQAIELIGEAGFEPTIENEAMQCFISTVDEFKVFYSLIAPAGECSLTWDIQNQWATGVPPSMQVYEALRPMIKYVHVKGGKAQPDSGALEWNVALEEATWPVLEIVDAVVRDGVSPVICLNFPSWGKNVPGYDYDAVTLRDLEYLRAHVKRGLP